MFEFVDEPWKATHATDLGSSCTPARDGVLTGWGPNALFDSCANEAFFGACLRRGTSGGVC